MCGGRGGPYLAHRERHPQASCGEVARRSASILRQGPPAGLARSGTRMTGSRAWSDNAPRRRHRSLRRMELEGKGFASRIYPLRRHVAIRDDTISLIAPFDAAGKETGHIYNERNQIAHRAERQSRRCKTEGTCYLYLKERAARKRGCDGAESQRIEPSEQYGQKSEWQGVGYA